MRRLLLIIACSSIALSGCKRYEVNEYELDAVYVTEGSNQKKNLKTDYQFISLMYSDIFETSISHGELEKLQRLQASFADKNVIIQRIAQTMLNDPLAKIESDTVMREQSDKFITETYQRFLSRTPNEAEIWYLKSLIDGNPQLTSKELYYAFITSEEYKYY